MWTRHLSGWEGNSGSLLTPFLSSPYRLWVWWAALTSRCKHQLYFQSAELWTDLELKRPSRKELSILHLRKLTVLIYFCFFLDSTALVRLTLVPCVSLHFAITKPHDDCPEVSSSAVRFRDRPTWVPSASLRTVCRTVKYKRQECNLQIEHCPKMQTCF